MQKIYYISKEDDFDKLAVGALKKVFSKTLFPRILANKDPFDFSKKFINLAEFGVFCTKNRQKFAKKVHMSDYDIGIFFFEKSSKNCFVVFDGTGQIASDFTTNTFDGVFCQNGTSFEIEKTQIFAKYARLDKKKLLVQKVGLEEFCKKTEF